MTQCPHCLSEFTIPEVVCKSIESYGGGATIAAPCCKKPLLVRGTIKFTVSISNTRNEQDDWGEPFSKEVKPLGAEEKQAILNNAMEWVEEKKQDVLTKQDFANELIAYLKTIEK